MKNTTSSFSKIMASILAVLMLFASVPVMAVQGLQTEDNTQQVEYVGGWNPESYPTDGTLYKDRVAVSKTVAPTEKENYFDITLKVVAKPRVIDQSVDVVLVMDNSNTMNATHQGLGVGSAGYNVANARLTHAKNAVKTFLDMYAVDENISEDRGFGLVTFNSYANTVVPITTVNTQQKATEIKNVVNGITAPTGNRERFTNIEGGLQLAHNLLKKSDAAFKYIIFITDGFPTTYIESGRNSTTQIVGYDTYMKGSYNASKVGTDGYFADSITKKLCLYGVNYSDKAADRADDVAVAAKKAGINIFSIGIDVGVQSIPDYLNSARNTVHTTVDRTSNSFVIGSTTESYKAWLRDDIAGGPMIERAEGTEEIHRYASGNSATELNLAFTNILNDIELIPAETMEEAYTIDPMSENVEFMYFYNLEGNPAHKVTNSKNGKDVAVFSGDTETIKWWLTTTQNWYIDDIGNYVLSLTYRVRLKNEAEGFEFNKALETNDKTTFYFKTVDFTTGEALFGDNSIDYLIPQVEGYFSDFYFLKQDSVTGHPLEGAEFTLMHYGDSCNVCGGDAVISDMKAKSDANGKVAFENIPSGHEYVLIETKAPEGYQRGAYHAVNITYGKTYLDGVLVTEEAPAVIKNQTLEPVEVVFTAHKTLEGRELKAGEFNFILDGVFEHGTVFHEKATNNEEGTVAFHEIVFDEVGTYTFHIYEEKGKDTAVVYDERVYEIEVVVALSADGKRYEVETFVDGVKAENVYAPKAVEFTNTLRASGTAQLEAFKTMDGEIPEDDVYYFNLKDKNEEVLQTKTAVGGQVTFDEIEYTSEGVYTYTITEQHPESGVMTDVFFDHTVYTAKVTVTAPKDDGAFETEVAYYKGEERVEKVLFENKTRTPATLKFNAVKLLDGLFPTAHQFKFLLTDAEGNVIAQVPNAESGIIEFPAVTFDEVGYYTYIVKEVKGDDEGIIYDKTLYEIHINVEAHHNMQGYYLDVVIEKPVLGANVMVAEFYGDHLDLTAAGVLVFENSTREKAQIELTAEKLFDGVTPDEESVFTFELRDEQGEVLQTVNNAGSEIVFEALEFTKSGIYKYTITETKGEDENVVYDTAEYAVTITVTASGDEAYGAQVSIAKDGKEVEEIIFFNTTIPESSTPEPSTPEPSTPEPSTPEPSTPEPSTPEPSTPEPTTTDGSDNITIPVDPNFTAPGVVIPEPTDVTGATGTNAPNETPDAPKTGEKRNGLVYAFITLVCMAGTVILGISKKKESEE
ncbi:MAG: VWA domain-containing protein [Ruminococcaceae bacterium]|nr:VWA domain-containing protein [Oscillospiraceae bacterium]